MRVLITGASGFIGKRVMDYFYEQGHEVQGWSRQATLDNRIQVVDVLKDSLLTPLKAFDPEIIVHCMGCASVGKSLDNPIEDFEGNTVAVYRVMEAMRKSGLVCCKFILLSSAAVYGQPESLPVWEGDLLNSMSPYALNKHMAEEITSYYRTHYQIQSRVIRIFSAYGEGLKKQIFWDMYQKIKQYDCLEMFGTGEESRDFIYISDLVNAIYLIATSEDTPLYINVANGKEVKIRYIAELFAKHFGIERVLFTGEIKEGDPKNWRADISVLKSLGYKQEISIEDGIAQYVSWAKNL